MSGPTAAARAQIAERRRLAVEMRITGRTWETIAAELGYSDRGAACKDVSRAFEERTRELGLSIDALREVELERLDALRREVWAVLQRDHQLVSHGRVITVKGDDGQEQPLLDDMPKLRAVDRLLRIAERRARLLGLDSPERVDANLTVRYTVEGIDPEALR